MSASRFILGKTDVKYENVFMGGLKNTKVQTVYQLRTHLSIEKGYENILPGGEKCAEINIVLDFDPTFTDGKIAISYAQAITKAGKTQSTTFSASTHNYTNVKQALMGHQSYVMEFMEKAYPR